jgi:toxin ParE1/3/4
VAELDIRFHPLAADEAEGARAWYAERNPVAANLFLAELEAAVGRVAEAPHRWPRLRGNIRRYLFPKFPFSLVYRVADHDIEIIAVAHHRRHPGYWRQR